MPKQRSNQKQGEELSPAWRLLLAMMAITALFWVWGNFFAPPAQVRTLDYSSFRQQLQSGQIERVTVQGEEIRGQYKTPQKHTTEGGRELEYSRFLTYLPSFGDEELLGLLEKQEVALQTRPQADSSWLWLLIVSLLPFVLIMGLIYVQYRRMGGQSDGPGGIFSMGKSRAKLYERKEEKTRFDDVGGLEGPKQELKEIVAFLKNPEGIRRLGGEVPRGCLLVGPPGTGKTLLARAVAGEAEVPFFSITGSDFMEMFVGVGASRVRSMFADAKKQAPAIIFIDELDSIGRRRGAGLGGGHDEREQTLNQLLSELDGFEPALSLVVMGATNRPDILDPALLRPGRFDRRVLIDLPSQLERLEILGIYAKNKPLAKDADLERLARGTPGFSGADLENLLKEAALLAARKERDEILGEDVEEARDKILLGLKRQGLALDEEEKRCIAYHEAGHAMVAALLPHCDPIHKVSIHPRAQSLGVTQQLPEKEQYIYRQDYLLDRLAVMMGGRASENLALKTATSGAGDDLQEATRLARRMVLEWGMGEEFRNMALGKKSEEVFLGQEIAGRRDYGEAMAKQIDEEIRALLDRAYERAAEVLKERREDLDRLAALLLEEGEITGEQVLELLGLESESSGKK